MVAAADLLVDIVHRGLHNAGQSIVIAVGRFPGLEEDVGVLGAAAQHRVVGVQGLGAEALDQRRIQQIVQILIVPGSHLADLVRRAEAVEKVQEGDLALQRGQMGHSRQIHDFLGIVGAQHGIARLAAGHHVGMVAENGQGVGRQGTGGHMDHAGQLAAGDFIHIGDHQQQTLGSREGCSQRSCL